MISYSQQQLLDALKSRDRKTINAAFESIYCAYSKLVAFIIGKYVSNNDTVKELVNEVFLQFFNHADNINCDIKYYLSTSAKNTAINFTKAKEQKVKIVELDYCNQTQGLQHSLDYNDTISALKNILDDFSLNVVLLHIVDGYTFKEIASHYNKNINTIITIYTRAIKSCKKEVTQFE
jgi:RNA polymerase sigma factor (sigma-70 family)